MNLNATILGQVIAFILFVLFCMKYIWPPLIAAIEKRQEEIAKGLIFAERAKKDLDIVQAEIANRLKQAKIDALAIIEQANMRKIQIMEETKAAVEAERTKILVQAKREIDTERKRMCEELRQQVAMLVVLGAEKVIERSVDEVVNSDIINKFIAKL